MDIKKYLNFIKIEHTLFSLPLIYGGVFLASREFPSVKILLFILLAAIFARTVAMTANRIIDAEIDKRNPRTKNREIPSGKISYKKAILILLFSLSGYFIIAYLISWFCFTLSPIPIVVFIVYPYLKRFTPLAHFGVGAGLSMGPLGGWFAIKNSFDGILPGILLSLFTFFWASAFDIIYSTLDEEFDRKDYLYSLPSKYGSKKALKISAALHFISFLILILIFIQFSLSSIAFLFLVTTGILLYLEHQYAERNVELAFFKINALVGFTVFLMIISGS